MTQGRYQIDVDASVTMQEIKEMVAHQAREIHGTLTRAAAALSGYHGRGISTREVGRLSNAYRRRTTEADARKLGLLRPGHAKDAEI